MSGSRFFTKMCGAKRRNFSLRAVFVVALAGAAAFAAAPYPASALEITDDIAVDTVWSAANEPYVIPDGRRITVAFGATLTIKPGVIVKFGDNTFLNIYGALRAEGTASEPIFFTSLLDDSVGGDTNQDGGFSSPSMFDWWGINFNGGSGPHELINVSLSYSYGGFWFNNSRALMDSVAIAHTDASIGAYKSIMTIRNTRLFDIGEGIEGYGGGSFDIASTSIEQVTDNDALAFYDGAQVSLGDVSVKGIGFGAALGLYGSHATATNSVFSGGFGPGIEIYKGWRIGPSSLFLRDSIVENYLEDGFAIYDSNAAIEHSRLSGNDYGADFYGGSLSITNSSILGNVSYGVANWSRGEKAVVVDARNNWWGDISGPSEPDRNPHGVGDYIYGNILFEPWLTSDPTIPPAKPDPVIIIPGLLGSAEKNGEWVIDPIFHTYDDLIETLAVNGYEKGKDLFSFPYDWRNSNVLTAVALRNKINEVKQACECGKVDVVAHSMGGLVARQYIQSDAYQGDIDQLIFLGTPHLGAPKAYLTWEAGETSVKIEDQFLKFLLSREAKKSGYSNLFDYVKNKPIISFQELLPVTNYLRDSGTGDLRTYPDQYPRNAFLEDLNGNVSDLFNSGVRITNIIGGVGTSTVGVIRVASSTKLPLWEHGYPDGFDVSTSTDKGLELGMGDGTVTLESAGVFDNDLSIVQFGHTQLPVKTEGLIYYKLTENTAGELVDKFQIPNLKILFIKILSPVDIVVIAPDGKRVGKDFATGNEINEIEGAFYSGFETDDEYVTIPNPMDGEYRVETVGTGGGGEYTVATGLIGDGVSSENDFTAMTYAGLVIPLTVLVNTDGGEITVSPIDVIPPEVFILSPEPRDYERSETLLISATSTDSGSGVFSFETRFNGKTPALSTVDLFFERLGTSTVSAFATDYVGNVGNSSVSFRVIATASSTISDIERAYTLGWITKKSVRNALVAKLNAAVRFEKRIEYLEEKLQNGKKLQKRIERILKRIDRVLGRQFLNELEREHPRRINDQAYQILKEDIEWLLAY